MKSIPKGIIKKSSGIVLCAALLMLAAGCSDKKAATSAMISPLNGSSNDANY